MDNAQQFGLAWFESLDRCLVVDAEHPDGAMLESPKDLRPDHVYLTNLPRGSIQDIDASDALKAQLRDEYTFCVKASAVAIDLGWQTELVSKMGLPTGKKCQILKAIHGGFLTAFRRAGIDPCDPRYADGQPTMRRDLWQKTMPEAFQVESWPDISPSHLASQSHAWVNISRPPGDDTFIRTISVTRSITYPALLEMPLPVGEWERGDPQTPDSIVLSQLDDDTGVLIKGKVTNGYDGPFVSCCHTTTPRQHFTAFEINALREESASIHIEDWWSGKTAAPELPVSEVEDISLGDSILLEMVHRSWRNNPATGYWMACCERMGLHGAAEYLHSSEIPVLGYGSGRITIASPRDPAALEEQDRALLAKLPDLCLQIPLNLNWEGDSLRWRLPMLSELQQLAISDPGQLTKIDAAIDSGDQAEIDKTMADIKAALEQRVTSS